VTLIQRFGSALNLNVHFHLLVLEGVYRRDGENHLAFLPSPAPSAGELQQLVQQIAARIGRSLERAGLITRDIENAYLAFDPAEEPPIHALLGASITYRIATGPREGQKVFTLQTLPAEAEGPRREVAESSGFSLHAGIAATAWQRDKLERLARGEIAITIGMFFVLCVITFFCFVSGQRIVKFLGQSGLNVVTRMMGLILAVIGVQMLIEGIKGAFALGG